MSKDPNRNLNSISGLPDEELCRLAASGDRQAEETLAATIGEESVTLEDVYEPYLMQLGFLTRTPRGRCVTQKAYQHLHKPVPGGTVNQPAMDHLSF